jgi:uncharacterized protein DUF3467
MAKKDKKSDPDKIKLERTDSFFSTYANNAYFESSTWDLKIIFGQLDQSSTPNSIKQNVAVSLPWAQAKIMVYYLRLHIAAEEIADGKIHIRPDVMPTEPPAPTPEQASDPTFMKLYEFATKLRQEFIANL